ncbi:MAG: helix-turn-helix domain-containing protein [Nitrospira sp.]|nr:helix-turn-helix domain-containing protein [Nitrospira sp.]
MHNVGGIRRLIGMKDAAGYTGLSVHTVYTMVSQRRIPYVKVGRLVSSMWLSLDTWIKQKHRHAPMPQHDDLDGPNRGKRWFGVVFRLVPNTSSNKAMTPKVRIKQSTASRLYKRSVVSLLSNR